MKTVLRTLKFAPLGAVLWLAPSIAAAQQHGITPGQALLQSCTSQAGSMRVDDRIQLGRARTIAPARYAGGASPSTCDGFTWVALKGNIRYVNVDWKGPPRWSAWDCSHSNMAWGLYKKQSSGGWGWVGGGGSFGNMPGGDNHTCVYDGTGFPTDQNWGSFQVATNAASSAEYRIAFQAWSHDDPNLGHHNYCADPMNCQWPVGVTLLSTLPLPFAKQDFTIFRPNGGVWWFADSTAGGYYTQQWGDSQDGIVPGDYDGDWNSDFAVRRVVNGKLMWYVINSQSGATTGTEWGQAGDIAVPGGDWDGDGRTDMAYFRPSTSQWGTVHSNIWTGFIDYFGLSTDTPLAGNYDGDQISDLTTFRPSNGTWTSVLSTDGSLKYSYWGASTDIPLTPDLDGDYRTDVAVWRPSNGTFYWITSSGGQGLQRQWGQNGDVPVPGYYDSDSVADVAVFRPSEGRWYYTYSTTGGSSWTAWGQSGDKPAFPFSRGGN